MIEYKLNRINKAKLDITNITYVKTNFNFNWIKDLLNSSYNTHEKTFCSMFGISYYLDKDILKNTIKELLNIIPKGSSVLFDYPNIFETEKEITNKKLASGVNEETKSLYSYSDIERIAEEANMLIYEHLNYETINNTYFYDYNTFNPSNKIIVPKGVSYVILIK